MFNNCDRYGRAGVAHQAWIVNLNSQNLPEFNIGEHSFPRSVHQAAEEEPAPAPADVTPFPLSQAPRARGKSCCLFCTAFSTVEGDSAMDHHVRTAHPETVYLKCVHGVI